MFELDFWIFFSSMAFVFTAKNFALREERMLDLLTLERGVYSGLFVWAYTLLGTVGFFLITLLPLIMAMISF